jgi:hypothetical protein
MSAERVSHFTLSLSPTHAFQARGGPRGRGAPRGGSGRGGAPAGADKPRREAILDLSKYQDERIRVKFTGGRQGMHPSLQLHPSP